MIGRSTARWGVALAVLAMPLSAQATAGADSGYHRPPASVADWPGLRHDETVPRAQIGAPDAQTRWCLTPPIGNDCDAPWHKSFSGSAQDYWRNIGGSEYAAYLGAEFVDDPFYVSQTGTWVEFNGRSSTGLYGHPDINVINVTQQDTFTVDAISVAFTFPVPEAGIQSGAHSATFLRTDPVNTPSTRGFTWQYRNIKANGYALLRAHHSVTGTFVVGTGASQYTVAASGSLWL